MNAHSIIEEVKRTSRTLLTEIESKVILSEAGIPTLETKLATSKEEAIAKQEAWLSSGIKNSLTGHHS